MKKVCFFALLFFLLGITGISFWAISSVFEEKSKEIPVNKEQLEVVEDKKTAKLTLVGDLLFETAFYQAIDSGDNPNDYFQLVKDYFNQDDLSIGNMEVVIGNDATRVSGGENYNFAAPSWVGDLVSSLDFEVLSTANNHAFDQGSAGVLSTLDYFANHSDILTVGTYRNREESNQLSIVEVNDIRFGFVAYTMGTNVKMGSEEEYMVHLYKSNYSTTVTQQDKERMKVQIEELKKQVDVVVVLIHWGEEYTFMPNDAQKDLASFFNTLGVDLVVGNHSHNIQPIEWIGEEHKTLVYYSLGNFVSADEDIPRTNETFNNAYQFGLLSQLTVIKENDQIEITDIMTEPIINYYNPSIRNFTLIPYHLYHEELENTHYRYSQGFHKEFILETYRQVIPKEFQSF